MQSWKQFQLFFWKVVEPAVKPAVCITKLSMVCCMETKPVRAAIACAQVDLFAVT